MAFGSDYLDQKVLGLIFGQQAWTIPNTYYVGLSTGTVAPGSTGTGVNGEISTSGTGYARVPLSNDASHFTAPAQIAGSGSGYQVQNSQTISFNAATANWGNVVTVFLVDALTGGNIIATATITSTVVNAGQTAQFAANSLTFQLT